MVAGTDEDGYPVAVVLAGSEDVGYPVVSAGSEDVGYPVVSAGSEEAEYTVELENDLVEFPYGGVKIG